MRLFKLRKTTRPVVQRSWGGLIICVYCSWGRNGRTGGSDGMQ